MIYLISALLQVSARSEAIVETLVKYERIETKKLFPREQKVENAMGPELLGKDTLQTYLANFVFFKIDKKF